MGRGRHAVKIEPQRQHNSMRNSCPICKAVPGQKCRRPTDAGVIVIRNLPHAERNRDTYPEMHRAPLGENAR